MRVDFAAARDDLTAFAELAGRPIAPWQADSLRLETLISTIVAPRQSGKSRSLALLALWWAFRRGGQRVLIISAGDEAAKRLLAEVHAIAAGSSLLRASLVDENVGLVTLSNGSEIRSVPASERQIRGWSTDLLLIDEAALVSDDLILGAAMPTVAARPDARVVMASSATTASGAFYDHVQLGLQGSEQARTFMWRLIDATWISPSVIQAARESMSEERFNAEFMGQFASGVGALFPRALLERATADFVMPGLVGLRQAAGMAGVDWGATRDRTALVSIGRLPAPQDGMFAVVCAHAWPSGTALDGPGGVIGEIAASPAEFERVSMEVNGLGFPLAQSLARQLRTRPSRPVPALEFVSTTQALKSATYGAIRMLLEQRRLVLPMAADGLLRELLLLRVSMTQQGGERIEAGVGHDDLADALMLAAGPFQGVDGAWHSWLGLAAEWSPEPVSFEGEDAVPLGCGLLVPRVPAFGLVHEAVEALLADPNPLPEELRPSGLNFLDEWDTPW